MTSLQTATIALEAEVRAHPNDPRYHTSLGLAYAALGRKDGAIREGKRAVELLRCRKTPSTESHSPPTSPTYTWPLKDHRAAVDQLEYLLSVPSWISVGDLERDST